jgi:hypothetical protein
VFWDETNNAYWSDMRSRYVTFDGVVGPPSIVGNCSAGGLVAARPADLELEAQALVRSSAPGGFEEVTYPETYGATADDALRAGPEGCRRFFVSFDPSASNGLHRYLSSWYGNKLWFISENGTLVSSYPPDGIGGEYSIPLTGVCNYEECSYQEIGICQSDPVTLDRQISHRRFTEEYVSCGVGHIDCGEPTEDILEDWITFSFGHLREPVAMANNEGVTVVLYWDDTEPLGDSLGELYATVIDN